MRTNDQVIEAQLGEAEAVYVAASERFDAARHAFETAEFELGMARADLAGAQARVAELRKVQATLRGPAASEATDGSAPSRTDAIVKILAAHGGPMGIGEVLAELAADDPEVKYSVVASTLNYLVHEGRAQRPSRGRYAAS